MTKHASFSSCPPILISAALIAGCNDKGEEKVTSVNRRLPFIL